MRTKKIILWFVFISIFVLFTQSISATEIIYKEIKKENITKIDNEINKIRAKQEKINSLIGLLNDDTITSLHELFILIWDMIGILIGHNLISLLIARLCCCWFIFPIVVMNDIVNINISGGGLMKYFRDYLDLLNVENLFYTLGLMAIMIIPFVYLLAFCLAIAEVIGNGFNVEGGIIEKIINDLRYIYAPDMDYNKLDTDIKIEYYNGGISWLSVIFLTLFVIKTVDKKRDGIDKISFLEFLLNLIKLIFNFILKILNISPLPISCRYNDI